MKLDIYIWGGHKYGKKYCNCKNSSPITTGFEDDFGYWDVCCDCGKRIEDGHHYYNHYDGEDHDEDLW